MAFLQVDFFSDVLGMSMQMHVLLPQKTSKQIGLSGIRKDGKYPTLYLLHGMSDDHTIWMRRTSIERYASELGIAVVMPSTHLGWYTDMKHGLPYWTYLSKELPQICRSFFPNMSDRREETFAAGLSMGGYGALKLALGVPETFGAAASLSGATDITRVFSAEMLAGSPHEVSVFQNAFGTLQDLSDSENDLFALARRLKASGKPLPPLFLWCGTEDFLLKANRSARDIFLQEEFSLTYSESPGDHSWRYWDEQIQNVLKWLPISKAETLSF